MNNNNSNNSSNNNNNSNSNSSSSSSSINSSNCISNNNAPANSNPHIVPLDELNLRMQRFRSRMELMSPDWRIAIIVSKMNQYYFTGTMQDGMLLIPRENEAVYWVRRSFERAVSESLFPNIRPMDSYRDAAAYATVSAVVYAAANSTTDSAASAATTFPSIAHLETETLPLVMYQRLRKYFPFKEAAAVDACLSYIRSVKTPYEAALLEHCGNIHKRVLEERVPLILREGMSEAELSAKLFIILIEEGHHGISRINMHDTEMLLGHVGFGDSSIYPTYFNGPGGNRGLSPAVPLMGSRERLLKKGDLIFVDIGCGYEGYHTDKTMTYIFGGTLPDNAIKAHSECLNIQNRISSMLRPGVSPANIYKEIMNSIEPDFLDNFMGFGNRRVKFLGHSLGLAIDEYPVISEGFNDPIEQGMFFAVEPKKGIENIGMVGVENTFKVTPAGGRIITGDNPGLLQVYPD